MLIIIRIFVLDLKLEVMKDKKEEFVYFNEEWNKEIEVITHMSLENKIVWDKLIRNIIKEDADKRTK